MDDLISRSWLLSEYDKRHKGPPGGARKLIEEAPSAQLDTYWKEQCQSYEQTINKLRESLSAQSEIVRCKDFKHWIPYDWMFSEVWQSKNIADYPEDEIGCDCCDMAMKANDFCSRVERRTE